MKNGIKITFMGAGSAAFVRNIIGDCMLRDALKESEFALYDIDAVRLKESETIVRALNQGVNNGKAVISTYLGVENRRAALKDADFIVNAIQVGGYDPATITDFEIPKKYGLRQTIGDTVGIGGIFRGLRTIPVLLDFARDIEKVCPDALFLNYSNPMCILTGALIRAGVRTVGLCHSVQSCLETLLTPFGLYSDDDWEKGIMAWDMGYRGTIAGINHMAWLLTLTKDGKDIYPEIRKQAEKKLREWRKEKDASKKCKNMVRLYMMCRFGYYMTESSEHNAEYTPYWIKSQYPELIDEFNIPLDEYPRRCVKLIDGWSKEYKDLAEKSTLDHKLSHEYGSLIINSVVTNQPCRIGGNVMNHGFITNLPPNAVVEVPCLVDFSGVHGTYVGALPPQCAALNMTNINAQLLTIEAALTRKKEHIYHAAMLDPHTSSELPIDKIVAMCDDLIKAHGNLLPKYK